MIDYKKDDLLFFLHLPKSAGTTLNGVIDNVYKKNEIFSIAKEVRKELGDQWRNEATFARENIAFEAFKKNSNTSHSEVKIVKGHMGFGWHEAASKNSSYFTFVREPIDRIVSQYYYIKRMEGHALQEKIKVDDLDLKSFVEKGISLVSDNGMTRKIAGLSDEIGFKEYDNSILDLAKKNIEMHFSSIGLSEYFDESIVFMKEKYGWKKPYYLNKNVTKGRKKIDSIDRETLKTIERHNALDIELYAYLKDLFNLQIESLGDQFESSLRKYRFWNSKYSSIYTSLKHLKSKFV